MEKYLNDLNKSIRPIINQVDTIMTDIDEKADDLSNEAAMELVTKFGVIATQMVMLELMSLATAKLDIEVDKEKIKKIARNALKDASDSVDNINFHVMKISSIDEMPTEQEMEEMIRKEVAEKNYDEDVKATFINDMVQNWE